MNEKRGHRSSYAQEIQRIEDPRSIHEALAASSPYVLMKAFDSDRTVTHLIKGGLVVVPAISAELRENGKLPEISRACFAYVLQKIDPKSASETLGPLFAKAVAKPGPFFVHFAAHALRQNLGLPVKPFEVFYTSDELRETLERVRKGR